MPFASLIAVAGLVAVHLIAGQLRRLGGVPRSRWLSFGGGVSVAYVFLHLLPELNAGQEVLASEVGEPLAFLDHHVYLLALVGLATFGLERAAILSRGNEQDVPHSEDSTSDNVFRVHMVAFAIYNTIIGYLLIYRDRANEGQLRDLVLFAIAIGWHFMVNDYGLREHHKNAYARAGRWILAGAVLFGWMLGVAFTVSEAVLILFVALLGGAIILNVLKEELPEERESRFWAFAAGAGLFAVVMLTV